MQLGKEMEVPRYDLNVDFDQSRLKNLVNSSAEPISVWTIERTLNLLYLVEVVIGVFYLAIRDGLTTVHIDSMYTMRMFHQQQMPYGFQSRC